MPLLFRAALAVFIVCLMLVRSAHGSDYGTVGLIDTPTARMNDDGILTFAFSRDELHQSYSITYQALPWLEATFRYSGIDGASPFTDSAVYYDRNYGVKVRLFEEDEWYPQVSLGIRDLIGTGIYGSEYIVASKTVGSLDASLGIGWGRIAGDGLFDNPFGLIHDRFNTRPTTRGLADTGTFQAFYFRGKKAGLFGGLTYSFDKWPVKAMVELNPDQYEFANRLDPDNYRPSSQISYGFEWEAVQGLTLSLSHQHGDSFGFGFRSLLDTKALPPQKPEPTFISSLYLPEAALPPQIDKAKWYDRLLYDVERSGLILVEASVSGDGKKAELVVGNADFPLWGDALGRHIALADLHLPATVDTMYMVVEDGGHRAATVVIPRPSSSIDPSLNRSRSRIVSGRTLAQPENRTGFATGQVVSNIGLNQRLQLFDPDNPARYQIYASIGSEYMLSNHWAIRARMAVDIENNFSDSKRRKSDSQLPNVRTGIVEYLIEGATGLESFMIEGRDTYGSNLHYRVFAGVLEQMYSGVGGEVLYWNSRSRFAYGLSMAYVKQRGFKRDFNHLDYEVLTGFASIYWSTPWHNYDVAVHAGQYLAKDVGATLDIRRTFRNGWQVGLFATLTDVPFDVFGEGSFDKGFYFQVPLGALFGGSDRSKFGTRIRPVLRDGGQRLEDLSGNIFWDLREARYDSLVIDERMLP